MKILLKIICMTLGLITGPTGFSQCHVCETRDFPIHCALRTSGCVLEDLAGYIAGGHNINRKDKSGSTPLHVMVYMYQHHDKEDPELLKLLLDSGADPSIPNRAGRNALDLALRYGKLDLVDFFYAKSYRPLRDTLHPYYMALKDNIPSLLKRYKRYEKQRNAFQAPIVLPVGLHYQAASPGTLSPQIGLCAYTDDFIFLVRTKGLLVGPVFDLRGENALSLELRAFYQVGPLDLSIAYRNYLDGGGDKFIDGSIGLAVAPLFAIGYTRRKSLGTQNVELSANSLYCRIFWPYTFAVFKRKKRSDYYKQTSP